MLNESQPAIQLGCVHWDIRIIHSSLLSYREEFTSSTFKTGLEMSVATIAAAVWKYSSP